MENKLKAICLNKKLHLEFEVKEADKYITNVFKDVNYYADYSDTYIICFVETDLKKEDIDYSLLFGYYNINGVIYHSFLTSQHENFVKNYKSNNY